MEGHFLPRYLNEVGRTMVFLKAGGSERCVNEVIWLAVTVDQKEKKSITCSVLNPQLRRENSQPQLNTLPINLPRRGQSNLSQLLVLSQLTWRVSPRTRRNANSFRSFGSADFTAWMFYFIKWLRIVVETFLKKGIKEFLKIYRMVLVLCRWHVHNKDRSGSKTN